MDSTANRDLKGPGSEDSYRVFFQVEGMSLIPHLLVEVKDVEVVVRVRLGPEMSLKEINTQKEQPAEVGDY